MENEINLYLIKLEINEFKNKLKKEALGLFDELGIEEGAPSKYTYPPANFSYQEWNDEYNRIEQLPDAEDVLKRVYPYYSDYDLWIVAKDLPMLLVEGVRIKVVAVKKIDINKGYSLGKFDSKE